MLRKLFPLLILIVLLLPWAAQAQDQPPFTQMTVDLWPEFDRPSMLVMYQFTLSSQVKLPAEVLFRMPVAAGIPNAVAVCEPGVNCYNTPFTQHTAGEWSELVIQATMPDVRIEYYDPGLKIDGTNRLYEYIWPGDHAVDNFSMHLQQPLGADQVRLKPGTATSSIGEDGLTYYSLDVGAVPAGQSVEVSIEYVKNTDNLTNTNIPVTSGGPLGSSTSGRFSLSSNMPFVLGGLGILLMVGGGYWYWRTGQRRESTQSPRRTRHKPVREASSTAGADAGGEFLYCHQCGNRAASGDRFCRVCGAPLRK